VVDHGHCPDGCDHPQPFRAQLARADAEFWYVDPSVVYEFCGRCAVRFGELVALVPCAPPYCEEP
jgi:hypothetical protein